MTFICYKFIRHSCIIHSMCVPNSVVTIFTISGNSASPTSIYAPSSLPLCCVQFLTGFTVPVSHATISKLSVSLSQLCIMFSIQYPYLIIISFILMEWIQSASRVNTCFCAHFVHGEIWSTHNSLKGPAASVFRLDTLRMTVTSSFETSVNFYQTTKCQIPENSINLLLNFTHVFLSFRSVIKSLICNSTGVGFLQTLSIQTSKSLSLVL